MGAEISAVFAFLHHLAAFAVVAALTGELVLVRSALTVESARRIVRFDTVYGLSAMALIVVGLLRVFYFEKGAAYYFHSAPFIAKLALFAIVGLLSIYPTREFLSWRKALKQGQVPVVDAEKLRTIRRIIHWELAAVALILLLAALAARGIGHFG
jgi:putative membrane protein